MSNSPTDKATYALLADNVYWDVRKGFTEVGGQNDFTNSNWTPVPDGWTIIDEVSGSGKGRTQNPELEGFTARVFAKDNTNEIVIAFAGTDPGDFSGDWVNNLKMGNGFKSQQIIEAVKLYHQIKHENPDADIKFTGHSLGGGLASVMGVLFDKDAMVFDHAPFKNALMNDKDIILATDGIADILKKLLPELNATQFIDSTLKGIYEALLAEIDKNKARGKGYTSIDDALLSYNPSINFDSRVSNVDATTLSGEFLEKLFANYSSLPHPFNKIPLKIPGTHLVQDDFTVLLDGDTSLTSISMENWKLRFGFVEKHSQTLLASALLSEKFEKYTTVQDGNNANINTLSFILDATLYFYSPADEQQNFLTKLVRNEVGGKDYVTGEYTSDNAGVEVKHAKNGMLTHFGNDLANIAIFLKTHEGKYSKAGYDAMLVQTIEWYYHQDSKTYSNKPEGDKEFFHLSENLIQYTTAQGEGLIDKGKTNDYTQKWVNEVLANMDEAQLLLNEELNYAQWNISFGNTTVSVMDEEQSQLLLTLTEDSSSFTSGKGDDLLIGNTGSDTIKGGLGDDTIYGDDGNDTLSDNGSGKPLSLINFKDKDMLYGGKGNDTLIASTGNDTLFGGEGFDTYDVRYVTNYSGDTTYGYDNILDSDGQGILKMQDRIPVAAYSINENTFVSSDGVFYFQRIPMASAIEGQKAYNLLIWEKDIQGSVTIHNWFEGDLGVELAELPPLASDMMGYHMADYKDVLETKTAPPITTGNNYITSSKLLYLPDEQGGLRITANQGDDIIEFSNQNIRLSIDAGLGNDLITTGNKDDVIWTDDAVGWRVPKGYDIFNNKPAPDLSLVNGLPHDENNVIYGNWYNVANAGAGNDVVYGYYGVDHVQGGNGDDRLFGAGNSDHIQGGSGSDVIHGDGLVVKQYLPKYWRDAYVLSFAGLDEQQQYQYEQLHSGLDIELLYDHTYAYSGRAYQNPILHPVLNIEYLATNLAYHKDDVLSGDDGDDIVIGEGGSDTIYGGNDNDILLGDNIEYETSGKLISLLDESVIHDVTPSEDFKKEFNEQLQQWSAQYSGKDSLYGGAGDDRIYAGSKSDYIEGNLGNDIIYADSELDTHHQDKRHIRPNLAQTVSGNEDFLFYYQNLEKFITKYNPYTIWGDDVVLGGEGNDTIYGEGGNDDIDGGEGSDIIYGDRSMTFSDTKQEQQYYEAHGDDVLKGGAGDDQILGQGGSDKIFAGNGDDLIYGDDTKDKVKGKYHGVDIIFAEDGNDIVKGQGGDDIIYGGEGDDELVGDDIEQNLAARYHGNDWIDGGQGKDRIFGMGGQDELYGQDGDDVIRGDADMSQLAATHHDDDIIFGGHGNDTLYGDGGNDKIDGGEDDDRIQGDYGLLDAQYHGDDDIDAGVGNDYVWGQGGDDWIQGKDGDDYLEGDDNLGLQEQYHGKDVIYGGAGNDSIFGGGNDDILYGGEGDDFISGDDANHGLDASKISGDDKLYGGAGSDTLVGGRGDDEVYGDKGDDYVYGGQGDDILDGGTGTNLLVGGAGNDIYRSTVYGTVNYFQDDSGDDTYIFDTSNARYQAGDIGNQAVIVDKAGRNIIETPDKSKFDLMYDFTEHGLFIKKDSLGINSIEIYGENSTLTIGDREYTGSLQNFYLKDDIGAMVDLYQLHQNLYSWFVFRYGQGRYTVSGNVEYDNTTQSAVISTLQDGEYGRGIYQDSDIDVESIHQTHQLIYADKQPLDLFVAGKRDNTIKGSDLAETVYSQEGNDIIIANGGNDTVHAGTGDDIIIGGTGNDILLGGDGDDRYEFAVGDGQDIIKDNVDNNHIVLSVDNPDLVYLAGNTLVYTDNDSVTIEGDLSNYQLEINGQMVDFADIQRDSDFVNNQPPVIQAEASDVIATQGVTIEYGFSKDLIIDPEGKPLKWQLTQADGSQLPSWLTFDPISLTLKGNPPITATNLTLTLTAVDDAGDSASINFDMVIQNNQPPKLQENLEPIHVNEGEVLDFAIDPQIFIDPEGEALDWQVIQKDGNQLPSWLSFDPISLRLTGYLPDDVSQLELIVMVTDNLGQQQQTFLTVHQQFIDDTPLPEEPMNIQAPVFGGTVEGGTGNDALKGSWFSDTLKGGAGDDVLDGGLGNDTLYGGIDNDTLTGGAGRNTLYGGRGDDTFIINNKHDAVIEYDNEGIDTVHSGIDYQLTDNLENLTLTGNKGLLGYGNSLDNILTGNSGNNLLSGLAGDDVIIGREGNDYLYGGIGNDTYQFGRGDGKDVIQDSAGDDTLIFTGDIKVNDLWFAQQGNSLTISLLLSDDQVTINNWFVEDGNHIETIQLESGKTLSHENIDQIVAIMNAADHSHNSAQISDGALLQQLNEYWA